MICLSVLLRRQWVEVEKCIFPLVKLPLEMSKGESSGLIGSFFRKKALWIGFALPVFIHIVNCSHAFFPSVPHIPLEIWLNSFLVSKPWKALKLNMYKVAKSPYNSIKKPYIRIVNPTPKNKDCNT